MPLRESAHTCEGILKTLETLKVKFYMNITIRHKRINFSISQEALIKIKKDVDYLS